MEQNKWSTYYENHKKLWYNPKIPGYVKQIVRIVELHRSDSKGWSLSIRKLSGLLGVSTNTILKYLDKALELGYIESSPTHQRKRRKLKLSVSLRVPDEYSLPKPFSLSQPIRQAVSRDNTASVSPIATVNNNINIKANNNKSLLNRLNPSKRIKSFTTTQSFVPKSPEELAAFEVWGDLEGNDPTAFHTTYLSAVHKGLPTPMFYQFRSEIEQDKTIKNPGAVFNSKVEEFFRKRLEAGRKGLPYDHKGSKKYINR